VKLAFRMRRGMDPAGPREYRLLAEVLADGFGTDPPSSGSPMPGAGGASCWSIP
jgi:hypothetical protein